MNPNKLVKDFKFPADIVDKGNEMTKSYFNLILLIKIRIKRVKC